MKTNFYQLVKKLEVLKVAGGCFYKLQDLRNVVTAHKNSLWEVGELLITPYYLFKNNIPFEILDYEFQIRISLTKDFEDYVYERTGKKLVSIDPVIIEKLKKCYIILQPNEQTRYVESIINYLEFLKLSKELVERIEEMTEDHFNTDNLYCEVY